MRRLVEDLGARVRGTLTTAGEMATLLFLSLRSIPALIGPSSRVVAGVAFRQVYFTGNQALPLTGLIAFLLGAVVVIQAVTRLSGLGAEGFAGDILVIAVLRELGPLVAAVIVIGRSGTAMAAELATMRLRGEIDDLDTLGIDPVQYLVLPRLAGAVVSLFGLMVFFDLLAVVGGYVALGSQTMTPLRSYLDSILQAIQPRDLALIPAKAILFGGMIAAFCCYRGLSVEASPTEIPQAATRGVVMSLVGIFVADSILATLVYS
ncbi:MAG: ABC transporter permease [Acidobacteria bacterium]|nr:ABC transporter permease [Acidobacteriota bacterium]